MSIKLTKQTALMKLAQAEQQARLLRQGSHDAPDFSTWKYETETALRYTFPDQPHHLAAFARIPFSPFLRTFDETDEERAVWRDAGLAQAIALLEALIREIEEFWPGESTAAATPWQRLVARGTVRLLAFIVAVIGLIGSVVSITVGWKDFSAFLHRWLP